MARYDYDCSICDEIREYEHAMSEDYNGITCSYCNVGVLFKKIRPAATHFKGQGWGKTYRTYNPKG